MKKKFRKVCSLPLALLSVAFATGCATTESSTASNSSAEVPLLKGNGNFTFNAKNVGYKSEHGYGFVAIDGNLDSVKCSSGMLSAEETVRFQANVENGNYKVTVITNQTSLISESITDNVPFTLKNEDGVEFTEINSIDRALCNNRKITSDCNNETFSTNKTMITKYIRVVNTGGECLGDLKYYGLSAVDF